MKTRQVLYFVICVLLTLLVLSLVFPKEGIRITKGFTLQFVTFDELFSEEEKSADLNNILLKNINLDSLICLYKDCDDTLELDAADLKSKIQTLEFSKQGGETLYPFFRKLKSLRDDSKLLRVMHYGDSQIECDRISSFLRYKLQNQFGGCGIGVMPVVQAFDYHFALTVSPSDNWLRYTSYGSSDNKVAHRNFGFLGSFCRFTPNRNDSLPADTVVHTGTIEVFSDNTGYANARKFKQMRMFYGNCHQPAHVQIKHGENIINDTLLPCSSIAYKRWVFNEYTSNLSIVLSSTESPDIYGLAFDDTYGVAVDNIALRGNSGTIFTSLNYNNLSEAYALLNVELFILQFGGNALPWIQSEEDCKNYARSFLSQIKRLKSIKPEAGIIVVGPADKSIKEKNKYVSYKYIEPLIKELKNAAFEGGAAYWDIYKAMGGKNSMPSWVNADLAGPDYIHFSPEGASIIANMLYNAIIYEYKNFLRQDDNLTKTGN